jgi:signal peptidase II
MAASRAGWIMAAIILAADQLSKFWIMGPLDLPNRGAIELLPIFRLVWTGNHGVSGGFLVASSDWQRWLLTAGTAAIAVAVASWLWREKQRIEAIALGGILGGAIGNIADRVRLGYVADFLNLHFGAWSPFLVFNVADAAITIGVLILLIRALFVRDKAGQAPAVENDVNA